jgi:hypothetical protein
MILLEWHFSPTIARKGEADALPQKGKYPGTEAPHLKKNA